MSDPTVFAAFTKMLDEGFPTTLKASYGLVLNLPTGGAIRLNDDGTGAPTIGLRLAGDTSDRISLSTFAGIPALLFGDGAGTLTGSVSVASLALLAPKASPTFTGHITLEGTTLTGKTGTGRVVLDNSPTLISPTLGVAAATTINKVTVTAPATGATLTIADGKTLTASNTLTLAGTDSTTMTFPSTSATIARTDAANAFTGNQTITGLVAVSSANGTNPNIAITSTTAASTGQLTLTVGNFAGAAPLTTVSIYKTAGDTYATVSLQDLNGTGSLNFGPGGSSTATDFHIAYGGSANATVTGVLTMTSPVISGHATIEGAALTGKTGTNLLVLATNPTLSGLTMTDATDITISAANGTKIGQSASKLAFYGKTAVVQPASANQATVSTTAPAGGTGAAAGAWDTSAHRDTAIATINSAVTLVNQMRADLVTLGVLKGSA